MVTLNQLGEPADDNSSAGDKDPAISGKGRFVAFKSWATDLLLPVRLVDNGFSHVYVRDLRKGRNRIISVAPDGALGNARSFQPAICSDGSRVAFASQATNLDTVDPNEFLSRMYVWDRATNTTKVITPNQRTWDPPTISADCRSVAYVGADFSIYAYDVESDSTALISRDALGQRRIASYPSLSQDGRFVAIESDDPNLVPGDENGLGDVFLVDRDADGNGVFDEPGGVVTERVSVGLDGTEPDDVSWEPIISGDGRSMAFHSDATNLVAGDTNGFADVFIYDHLTRSIQLISRRPDGGPTDGESSEVHMSADGRYVGFKSLASDLVREDSNGDWDAFLYDRDADRDGVYDEPGDISLEMLSVDKDGLQRNAGSWDPWISDNGRRVVFGSTAPLDPRDTNIDLDGESYLDVYLRTRKPLPIKIKRAVYRSRTDRLVVRAVSDLGADGALELEGYGPMIWNPEAKDWRIVIEDVGGNPGAVTVSGPKGYVRRTVAAK